MVACYLSGYSVICQVIGLIVISVYRFAICQGIGMIIISHDIGLSSVRYRLSYVRIYGRLSFVRH